LRLGLQTFIDRRFYRRKYDAEQILIQFAATARSETEIQALTRKLLDAVESAMQPDKVSLWMRKESFSQNHSLDA
jgi:hypothetical protein